DALGSELERCRAAVAAAEAEAPVPTCPDWDVRHLAEHTGSVHRWAAHMVANVSPERVPGAQLDFELPETADGLPAWLAAGGRRLLDALRGADPDAGMWGWGSDQHARFWSRRMVHETTV